MENTVIASSGDLAYTVGFERSHVSVDGAPHQRVVISKSRDTPDWPPAPRSRSTSALLDLVGRDGFFAGNDLLAVSSFYPGLELAATGVHWLTGLPLVGAQILVVLLARSVLVKLFTLVRRGTGSGTAGGLAVLLYAASPQFYFLDHQAVATALLVALACLLVRSFDRGSPASARRRDSRRTAAENPKVSVDTSTRPTPSAPAEAVSRTTMLAFSGLGNTDALATSRRISRPDIGLAMTPAVASAASRWRLTRQPLGCC